MKRNIKEIGVEILNIEDKIAQVSRDVSRYTPEFLTLKEAKENANDSNASSLAKMIKYQNDIIKLQIARAKLNSTIMSGLVDDEGNEYTLLGLIILIKSLKDLISNLSVLLPYKNEQTRKRLDGSIGNVVFAEYNGNVEEIVAKINDLKAKVSLIQNKIDYLNVSEYIETYVD